jgi:hypothetical protein
MVSQGIDHPLATLGESELSGGQTHNLADSKGMWVYHMLRREVGDEIFFATLRGLIRTYSGRQMSLDDIRNAFIAAAPEAGLEKFFAMWLDRKGAPRIEVAHAELDGGRQEVALRQTQQSAPFDLDIEAELVFADGSTRRERISLTGRDTNAIVETAQSISGITLDPDHNLLLWRPGYEAGPMVDGEPLPPTAEWVETSAYLGTYRIEMLDQTVEVTADNGRLWVRIGDVLRQLFPHEPHRFLTVQDVTVVFTMEDGVASGFTVTLPDGKAADGVRIE